MQAVTYTIYRQELVWPAIQLSLLYNNIPFYYIFSLPFIPLTLPSPCKHHPVLRVHESCLLFAWSLHLLNPPYSCHPALYPRVCFQFACYSSLFIRLHDSAYSLICGIINILYYIFLNILLKRFFTKQILALLHFSEVLKTVMKREVTFIQIQGGRKIG